MKYKIEKSKELKEVLIFEPEDTFESFELGQLFARFRGAHCVTSHPPSPEPNHLKRVMIPLGELVFNLISPKEKP